jgi:molybdopterin converting factor small subunit
MQIRILLFGGEAAALGRDSVVLDIEPPTCTGLRQALERDFPAVRPHLSAARFAINSQFAGPDQPIRPGDEVALIGLVGGG